MSSRPNHQASLFSTTLKQIPLTLLLMIAVVLQTPSSAQVLYGSITGNVTDPNGAAVAGAQVEARNVNTGTTQSATSDSSGIYRFVTVLPGTYTITITAAGFARQENQNILAIVNTVRRVDVALTLAKVRFLLGFAVKPVGDSLMVPCRTRDCFVYHRQLRNVVCGFAASCFCA